MSQTNRRTQRQAKPAAPESTIAAPVVSAPKEPAQATPSQGEPGIRLFAEALARGETIRDTSGPAEAPQTRAASAEHPLTPILAKLHLLRFELAEVAPRLGEHFLDAARVIEGVSLCLSNPVWNGPRPVPRADSEPSGPALLPDPPAPVPRADSEPEGNKKGQQSRLARAATDLVGKASRLPRKLRESRAAADALVEAVKVALDPPPVLWSDGPPIPPDPVTPRTVARHLESARTLYAYLGARRVLPHNGSRTRRIAILEVAIKKLWKRVSARDERLPRPTFPSGVAPWPVVQACARALSNDDEVFGAQRKRAQRERRKAP